MEKEEQEQNIETEEPLVMETKEPERPFVCVRDDFDCINDDPLSLPFLFLPKQFHDNRGCFAVCLGKGECDTIAKIEGAEKFSGLLERTVQINRSFSIPGVFRGFHAQKAPNCQGKLVECLTDTPIWDIIVDARPDSKTFQQYTVFKLTGPGMEKVWVPRGFLHGFMVPRFNVKMDEEEAGKYIKYEYTLPTQIQYFADAKYSKEDEIGIQPDILLQIIMQTYRKQFESDPKANFALYGLIQTYLDGLTISEKDNAGIDIKDFLDKIVADYKETGKVWYR